MKDFPSLVYDLLTHRTFRVVPPSKPDPDHWVRLQEIEGQLYETTAELFLTYHNRQESTTLRVPEGTTVMVSKGDLYVQGVLMDDNPADHVLFLRSIRRPE